MMVVRPDLTGTGRLIPSRPRLDRALAMSTMVAVVDEDRCVGCGICVAICKYEALRLSEGVSKVDLEKCTGCGGCAASCPNLAINLKYMPLKNIMARARALLRTAKLRPEAYEPRLLVFACDWFSRRGADLGLLRKAPHSSNVRIVKLTCMSSLDPLAVLDAFLNGADGVLAIGCGREDCNFMESNLLAEERAKWLGELLSEVGVEPERFRLELVPFSEAKKITEIAGEMLEKLRELGPLRLR